MAMTDAASSAVVRRTLVTAWLALLVPLGGILLAIAVGNSDEDIASTDAVVTWGFLGGSSIGLALWIIGANSLVNRPFDRGRRPATTVWTLLIAWPAATAVFLIVAMLFDSGGAGAGLATFTALMWWWRTWTSATSAVVETPQERVEGPPGDGPSEASG